MSKAIFLSASVPDPRRGPEYAATADSVAIQAAVSALVHVTLGRRRLIWGGHPSITPMIWVVAEAMGIDYGAWVTLYQSRHFKEDFPAENKAFQNVVFTEDINENRSLSLVEMRTQMFEQNNFDAAVFVGGMEGILDEYKLFSEIQNAAKIIPVAATGGAALELASKASDTGAVSADYDFVAYFHRTLEIPVQERRFINPAEQPDDPLERLWKPETR